MGQQEDTADRAPDPTILLQYKDLIREQDQRISEISRANIYLQQELANTKQQLEEGRQNIQELHDQNALLKTAQQVNGGLNGISNGPLVGNLAQSAPSKHECNEEHIHNSQSKILLITEQLKESEEKLRRMEIDLRARDTV